MSDKRSRKHSTAQQQAQAVRRHLAGKEAASDLADELGLQPSQIGTGGTSTARTSCAPCRRTCRTPPAGPS